MNDLETRIRRALEAEAAAVRPHPGALEDNRRRLRRTVQRRRVAVPALAALSAATVTVSAFVALKGVSPTAPAAEPDPDVARLVSLSSIVKIPGRVRGGADFQVEALGKDGSVLGRSPDATVWQADAKRPKPKSLGIRAEGGLATGPGFRSWIPKGGVDISCQDGRGKMRAPESAWLGFPFISSSEAIAWHDGVGQPHASIGCGPARFLNVTGIGNGGEIVAVSGTDLFITNPLNNKDLREIDIRTGRVKAVHPLPAGVPKFDIEPAPNKKRPEIVRLPKNWETIHTWYAAATPDVFVWAAGGRLRAIDRQTWRETTVLPVRPPAPAKGTRAIMTAGDRVVAYTARTAAHGWRSVLFNARTGGTLEIPGQAYATGDRLLWRQGTDYRLARVN